MSQYSHVCLRCGYTSINPTASYMQCPACRGTQKNIHTRLPDSGYRVPSGYLYTHRCSDCGWTTPPTSIGGTRCPVCNKSDSRIRTEKVYSNSPSSSTASNSYSSGSYSNSPSDRTGGVWFLLILAFAAISFLAFWMMMPAWILIWIFNSFIDFSVLGSWITAILLTVPMIWLTYNKVTKNEELKSKGWWIPLVIYAAIDLGIVILLGILTLIFGLDSYWEFLDQFKWW